MRKGTVVVALSALLTVALSGAALAQTTASPTASSTVHLLLIPYEAPESKDPHGIADTKELSSDLTAAGIAVIEVAPMPHLQAVAQASKLCADNGAAGLLIPDGRSEQTMKRVPIPFLGDIIHYPTHVEFRLDEVGCDGIVRWSTTTTGDQSPGGLDSAGNLGAAVDAAFRSAILDAVHDFAAASPATQPAAPAAIAATPATLAAAAPSATPSSYVLLSFAQPKMADPRAADITQSLLKHLQANQLNVVVASTPIDHLTTIASAAALCSSYNAQAIIVPDIRIEQSSFTGRSYAALHLTQVDCKGTLTASGSGRADMGNGFIGNFGAAAVGVSERAMDPAIAELLGKTPPASAAPSPAP